MTTAGSVKAALLRTETRAKLQVLADTMRKGLHGNLVDVPVSPKLDEWVEDLDLIIAGMLPASRESRRP